MRVLTIGNFGHGWDGSICDEEHIAKALEELGHEVGRCQRDHIEFTDGGQWDFTLVSQWDGYGDLSNLPRPIVYWAFDYQADGQAWHERLIEEADLYLSKRLADSKYPNWQWLSQDFAPAFLDKYPEPIEKDIDVLFTGSYLPWAEERTSTLQAVDEKFDLHIYSVTPGEWQRMGLKNVHGPVMDHGLPELYARAKVILSIDHTIEVGYWSDRNAQIMACGRAPLFRYVPFSEATFREHAIYYYTIEGCLERIEDLLVRLEEDMLSVDQQAYEFAQKNLMVNNRVDNLIRIIDNYLCQR